MGDLKVEDVAEQLNVHPETIRRWLRRGEFPERKPPHRAPAKVTEFAEYLEQRWKEGCHNASRLYHELRQKGSGGKRGMVATFVAGWRKTCKRSSSKMAPERISPKHAAILQLVPLTR